MPISSQVMISQYIETNSGSTPKGIEVYNHTAKAIDFSTETLEVYKGTNGSPCGLRASVNSGILGPYQVWVIGKLPPNSTMITMKYFIQKQDIILN